MDCVPHHTTSCTTPSKPLPPQQTARQSFVSQHAIWAKGARQAGLQASLSLAIKLCAEDRDEHNKTKKGEGLDTVQP